MPRIVLIAFSVVCAALVLPGAAERGVSFEQRVAAHRTLERLRHSHQEGAREPLEQAVPRDSTDRRVRTQLQESVALEQFWETAITPEMLQREMERIAESTLFPDRLLEIYAAFDHDPILVREALARPALVERLTRDFFASDERIHGEARAEAERLRERLMQEQATAEPPQPGGKAQLRIVEMVVEEPGPSKTDVEPPAINKGVAARSDLESEPDTTLESLTSVEYAAERSRLPGQIGEVGAIEEGRDAFVIRRVLSEDKTSARVAVYQVPKISWQTWWSGAQGRFAGMEVPAIARSVDPLPRPGARASRTRSDRPGRPDQGDGTPQLAACPPDDTWDTQRFESVPRAMSGHSAVWTGHEMIVWGGGDRGGFIYDTAIDSWRSVSREGAPLNGPALWTGHEMLVWDGLARTGGRYDPVTDSWSAMAVAGSPSPRSGYSVVWTGTELIVWGGFTQADGALNSGARYSPVTDRWTSIANRDLPSGLSGHQAIWTGTEMIVWGSWGSSKRGARYDPDADRWRPIAPVDAGNLKRVLWTGTEMLVWGTNPSKWSVVHRYDPVDDSWSTSQTGAIEIWESDAVVMADGEVLAWNNANTDGHRLEPRHGRFAAADRVNSPAIRAGHSTLWTGDRMIVWGGGTNTGGRYDPVADAWTPTATPTAPGEHSYHRALWTGNEMFVVGGGTSRDATVLPSYDALTARWRVLPSHPAVFGADGVWTGGFLVVYNGHTGARYDPIAGAWLGMSQVNFPRRDEGEIMVWSGSELLVWGGHYRKNKDDWPDTYPAEVARYDPKGIHGR